MEGKEGGGRCDKGTAIRGLIMPCTMRRQNDLQQTWREGFTGRRARRVYCAVFYAEATGCSTVLRR